LLVIVIRNSLKSYSYVDIYILKFVTSTEINVLICITCRNNKNNNC